MNNSNINVKCKNNIYNYIYESEDYYQLLNNIKNIKECIIIIKKINKKVKNYIPSEDVNNSVIKKKICNTLYVK